MTSEALREYIVTGTWDVRVTLRNCSTGATFDTFHAVDTFLSSDRVIETMPGGAPGPGHSGQGSWRHLAGNSYLAELRFLRFNGDGSIAETQKVTRRLELSEDGQRFTGTSAVETFDAKGRLILARCSTERAKRIG